MLAARRPESVREAEEALLVDRAEHRGNSTRDDLVFQRRDPRRALSAIGRRHVPSLDGQRPVRAALDSCMQIQEIALQICFVAPLGHTVHSRCSTTRKRQERVP